MKIISPIPKYPKIGYRKFNKLLKPILLVKIAIIEISIAFILYVIFVLHILFKKLYPADIAVVNIAIRIVILYKLLYVFPKNTCYIYNWYF